MLVCLPRELVNRLETAMRSRTFQPFDMFVVSGRILL
jgi:hypothetical protein